MILLDKLKLVLVRLLDGALYRAKILNNSAVDCIEVCLVYFQFCLLNFDVHNLMRKKRLLIAGVLFGFRLYENCAT